MRWIADAGATKTDWIAIEGGDVLRTEGLNAEIEGWDKAAEKLRAAAQLLQRQGLSIAELYYYGPALHRIESQHQMHALLVEAFGLPPEKVFVYHDLLGAARAALGDIPGIVCILGTGSNCAFWNGEAIVRQAGGHGYLLGDEGSGADLGRTFLSALLHEEVPLDVAAAFWQKNPFPAAATPLELRRLVYEAKRPSAVLAQLAPFLSAMQGHPWVAALVRGRLRAFIQRTWTRWESAYRHKHPIRYVGGIAGAFASLLQEETIRHGGRFGGVIPHVAQALAAFHARQ